ncbi:MAG: ATP-dependent DNA helicase DinG [Bacillaceae bacterium]
MKRKYVIVDLETTGNSSKAGDRIIQFAAVVIEENVITQTFSTFVNPNKEIPPFITNLTGIKESDVSDAPPFSAIIPQLYELFKDSVFVAHNIHFDYVFLEDEFKRHGYQFPAVPIIDTVELSRILLPTMDSYKLTDLAESLQMTHERPHQADSDALVTATLFLYLIETLKQLPLKTLQTLLNLSKYYKSELNILLSSVISSTILESREDEEAYIELLDVVVRKASFHIPVEENVGDYRTIYKEVQSFANFQLRESQLKMMDIVHETLLEDKFAVIEAGTGIGKTLGYLIPALSYATRRKEQVIVSTYSLQLQNQLMAETIPMLERAMNKKINASVLKGRKHYLSLRKFAASLQQDESNYDIVLTKSKIAVWLTKTVTGDVEELHLPTEGTAFWEEICCSYQDKESFYNGIDYYERAVYRAMSADIIITNHALLLHDIGRKERIFEGIETIVIDEAHRFVETATGILGQSFSAMYCNRLLTKMILLIDKLKKEQEKNTQIVSLAENIRELKLELDDLFRLLYQLGQKQKKGQGEFNTRKGIPYAKIAATTDFLIVEDMMKRIMHTYKKMYEEKKWLVEMENPSFTMSRLNLLIATFEEKMVMLETFFHQEENKINWLELEQKGTFHSIVLYMQPVSVATTLQEAFFRKLKRGIFTSATLSVDEDFQFFLHESGLEKEQPTTYVLPSPFDYKNKVKVFVPVEIPSYKKVKSNVYAAIVVETIEEILANIEGRALVLFQSNELLQDVYEDIKTSTRLEDTVMIAQGTTRNRNRLTKYFKQFQKAALFGGLTFWEGIDFDGAALDCVIIVRLPFSSPDHPYVKLKSENIDKQGGSAFQDFSLPQAILRFKQGFGRLIRSEENKGVIYILDQRIMEAHYGKKFLHSIPMVATSHEPLDQCIKEMKDFLKENNNEQ